MHLRLALFFGLASLGAVAVACSSDDVQQNAPITGSDAATTAPQDDAGTDAGPTIELGEPITGAKAGEWTFVPFADSSCANGSPTGIGINPGTSKRLVIYLEGGGACWDANTCYGSTPFASNLDGWDEAKFEKRMETTAKSHLDRDAANNPFKDASFVYVPYCTGDVHAGDKEQTYGTKVTKHVGRRNLEAFLKRLAPTFEDADRVVLTGSSAGGFGAAVNYWRVKKYWSKTRVDLIDDSGPPFPSNKMANLQAWITAWDLPGAIAPDCTDCANLNFPAILPYYAKTYPEARFSLLSYDHDYVISLFYGLSEADFATQLAATTSELFESTPNAKAFEIAGTEHTMLDDLTTKSGDKELGAWLNEQESDAASWATVKPAAQP